MKYYLKISLHFFYILWNLSFANLIIRESLIFPSKVKTLFFVDTASFLRKVFHQKNVFRFWNRSRLWEIKVVKIFNNQSDGNWLMMISIFHIFFPVEPKKRITFTVIRKATNNNNNNLVQYRLGQCWCATNTFIRVPP